MESKTSLKELLSLCSQHHVKMIEYDGILIEFHERPQTLTHMQNSRLDYGELDIPGGSKDKEMPSDEELLGWSTSIDLAPEIKK